MDITGALGLIFGMISVCIAIYQQAVIRAGERRKCEMIQEGEKQRGRMQYALAGINNSALQKQLAWNNRISTLPSKLETDKDWELANTLMRGRDAFSEIASLTVALEGTIDSEISAIQDMLQRSIDMTKLNNELQTEALKNPTRPKTDTQ